MKKKKLPLIVLFVVAILMMSLYSCKSTVPEEIHINDLPPDVSSTNPFENKENLDDITYAYGFGIYEPKEGEKLEYDGEPIELVYQIVNEGSKMDIGLMITIDGIVQQYQLEDSSHEQAIHSVSIPAEKTINVSTLFTPSFGISGDEFNVRFLFMLNPETKPDKLNFIFGNDQSINQIFPKKLTINANVDQMQQLNHFSTPQPIIILSLMIRVRLNFGLRVMEVLTRNMLLTYS